MTSSTKRQRQKEGRQLRLEEERARQQRSQRMRQVRALVLVIVAILGVALLISVLGGGNDDAAVETDAPPETEDPGEPPTAEAPSPDAFSDPELAAEVLSRETPEPEPPAEDTPADALEVETLIEGTGREHEPGDLLVAHYYGVLPDGSSFDDSWSRGEPFQVTIPGGVIDGWNEGLVGVRVGERRRLVIGSELAYGEQGRPGIPPDSPLVFEVDVVDVVPSAE